MLQALASRQKIKQQVFLLFVDGRHHKVVAALGADASSNAGGRAILGGALLLFVSEATVATGGFRFLDGVISRPECEHDSPSAKDRRSCYLKNQPRTDERQP